MAETDNQSERWVPIRNYQYTMRKTWEGHDEFYVQ